MGALKWLIMFIFATNWSEEEAVCKQGATPQPGDEVTSVGAKGRGSFQRRIVLDTTLCPSRSSSNQYLEIKLKYFYDVCAVTTWTDISRLTDTNFKIKVSYNGHFWDYYREMGKVKVFQGAGNKCNISLHHLHLTTKYIRFYPVKWDKGSCLQFNIQGNIASCKSSERRLDLWCRNGPLRNNVSNARCSGDLRARFDRGKSSPIKLWRCYYESALTSDFSGYNDTLKSSCYVLRHFQLQQVSKTCTKTSSRTIECCSPAQRENEREEKLNISEYIADFSQLTNAYETTAQMSSEDILDVVRLLENVTPNELLRNATQQNRDLFAKTYLGLSSTLFNETNIPTWRNLQNSTTLSRLLKVVEEFGVAFTKYLDCDNETENKRTFSFSNIKFIAKSCVDKRSFPITLSSIQGCNSDNDSSYSCNASSNVMDSAIIPEFLLNENQRWQLSFVSYKNAHRIFAVDSTKGNVKLETVKVDSRVMSLTVKPDGLISNENPVVLTFKPFSRKPGRVKNFHCGFWNFSIDETPNGAWSTDGCIVLSTNTSQVTCQCTHLTNFALLVQVNPDYQTQGIHKHVLKWMTYLGCSLSLAAEILCLLTFILLAKVKEIRVKIHINLVGCLAVGHLVFLIGVENAAGHKMICSIVAVSIHFFFLASFMWMLVEGIHLLSRVKTVFKPINKLRVAYALAYGLPLVIVGSTFAAMFNEYGTLKHCWLSVSSGTIWSFIGPVSTIVSVNIIVLAFVLHRLTKTRIFSKHSDWKKIRVTVRASLLMVPLLGLSWFFGLLAVNQDTIVFQYLFVGLNSLQGVFLFFSQCVVHEEVKAGFRNILRRRRITQQVTRIVSKARSNAQTPEDHQKPHRLSPKEAFSVPGTTVVDHRIKVVQTVRLTKVTQKSQDNNGAVNKVYQPEFPSKVAWGKTSL
ncbi:adhesion G protein-coupled receptor E3-like isoform X2 [Orbicella faveolata]|uniref:adhesion G protein-coupled receptor E3-like isoform X2 n=1 Tax=Orbicella faveolata TaxID=48498 RepID=UPI0009E4FD7C|nr:adhesion G protein-coupled receptor E3-like isoform X2 [Orbicella faveolata]